MSLTTRERGVIQGGGGGGAYIREEKHVSNLGGLYSGELIHGRGAYLRNFTVYNVLSVCLL